MPVSDAGVSSPVVRGAIVLLHLHTHLDVLTSAFYSFFYSSDLSM